jgi:hypothetical protein
VYVLRDSYHSGSSFKLRSELSAKFKVFGVIRPEAGAEKIVNSFVEDLQNLHSHDFIVLNAGANNICKNNKGGIISHLLLM